MAWAKYHGVRSARYGTAHMNARKAAAAKHQPTDPCVRFGHPLGPMGPGLHYDHTDDGTRYLGFAHGVCNKRAGARKGARRAHARQHAARLGASTIRW